MRLVVCVDRDDDLGRKAGVQGPVVGRAEAIDAATRLAVADPEDSDTNAIFAAVSLLDELRGAGEECEVCVLTGSPKVGVLSDRRVAGQFDDVLARVKASSAYLVSDGAEDEYLFPILASRVKIDGVRRVYIRQSASLESTYYTLVRALKDPKLRAKTVLPFAIVLLTLGIAAATGVFLWGIIGLAILLGVYLVFWTFDIDEAIIDSIRSASTDIRQGSSALAFGIFVFSIALVGVGFLEGYNAADRFFGAPIIRVLDFVQTGVPWWVGGALVWESARAVRRTFVRGHFPRGFAVAATSIVGVGFLSYGILDFVRDLEGALPTDQFVLWVAFIVVGFGLLLGAGVLQQYWKIVARRSATETTTPAG
jgi:putative membrane protein